MKKIYAIIGSLLISAGIKAQTAPTVKKETTAPPQVAAKSTNTDLPVKITMKDHKITQKETHIKDTATLKSQPVKQVTIKETAMKDAKAMKEAKAIKEMKAIKAETPAKAIKQANSADEKLPMKEKNFKY